MAQRLPEQAMTMSLRWSCALGARILLFEDDATCLELLETVLHADGYDVTICASPEDVITHARLDPEALAVADFWGESQHTLALDERRQVQHLAKHVPTILITARSWAETCSPAELGLVALLRKPFGLDALYETVAACVATLQPPGSSHRQRSSWNA